MKKTMVMLAVAAASMVALAQPPPRNNHPTHAPAPATADTSTAVAPMVKKVSAQVQTHGVSTPLKYLNKPLVKHKVWSVDGISSRPWVQIVGIHPGYSAFPRPERHESTFYVFWIGHDPR